MLTEKSVSLASADNTVLIVIASPKELTHPIFLDLFHHMVALRMFSLFCIDEVRLFAEHGMLFCKDFVMFQDIVLSELIVQGSDDNSVHARSTKFETQLLRMKASFDREFLELLMKMTKTQFGS